jgi:hypothetical protein
MSSRAQIRKLAKDLKSMVDHPNLQGAEFDKVFFGSRLLCGSLFAYVGEQGNKINYQQFQRLELITMLICRGVNCWPQPKDELVEMLNELDQKEFLTISADCYHCKL